MNFLQNKNILIISPEAWGTSFLSKHHYAIELSKTNKVWFLNPPLNNHNNNNNEPVPKNIIILKDKRIRGLRHMPRRVQRFLITKQIEMLESRAGVKFQVVWSFDNSRYFHHDLFYDALVIHHVVDEHMDYNFQVAAASADLCLGVTHGIVERLRKFNQRSFFVQHAFSPFEMKNVNLPSKDGRIKLAYVGNLMLAALDIDFIDKLARKFSQCDFYLIGSYGHGNLNETINAERKKQIELIQKNANIFLLGERVHDEAFSFSANADIQIIVYFNTKKPMSNSSKLPFYFYNGNVIVSNKFTEYSDTELMRSANNHDEFEMLLSDTIARLPFWNDSSKKEMRRNHALQNSYSSRLMEIEKHIVSELV